MIDIRLEHVHKAFRDVTAVRDLTITFPAATTTCLLGPSGCGKTTLMRMIAGLEQPTSGDIFFGNERVTGKSPSQRNIGMVFQYPVVYRGISVRRNIELPLIEDKLAAAERQRRIAEVAELLDLRDQLDRDITQLDNSARQKVAVARAVARQPKIILFDEPITNVDINAKLQLKRALKDLVTRLKQTIVYVTHDQTEAMTLADQIALMKDGNIVQFDPPRTLYNQPEDAFGGWFLGSPGMNFFEQLFEADGNARELRVPLFPAPLRLIGAHGSDTFTLGIRPEHVRVTQQQTPRAVPGTIVHKTISTGGQYLLTLKLGERLCKAKVEHNSGRTLTGDVWVEFPLDRIRLFGTDGHRPHVTLEMLAPQQV